MADPHTTSFADPVVKAEILAEYRTHESIQMYRAFALARHEAYAQAERDLESIRQGKVEKGSLSPVRLQAAYALAYEEVYKQLEELNDLFLPIGAFVPAGLSFIGMCSTEAVKPGQTVRIMALGYDYLTPMRIIVADHCADLFDFVDVRVGNVSAMTSPNRVPCWMFTRHNHILGPVEIPDLSPPMYLTFDVLNKCAVPTRFESTVFCLRKAAMNAGSEEAPHE